jgi:nucleoside-diphosphate-sugar epimerase
VYLSSSAVYGVPQELPLAEDSEARPLGKYGRAKYLAEKVCDKFRQQGLSATIIRPRTVVGPRRLGIFHVLYKWIARGKRVWLLGRGDNKLQLVSARDLAEACILAAERGGDSVYNIGATEYGTLRDDLQALIDHAGTGARLTALPAGPARLALRMLDRMNLSPLVDWHYLTVDKPFYFNLEKAQRELGWQPQDSNVNMLIESYQWFLTNRSDIEGRAGTTHRLPPQPGLLRFLDWL